MPESQTRVVGSGWTSFAWQGQRLAWLETVSDTAPRPLGNVQTIQPLDAETPVEIVTPRAVNAGTLQLSFYELWNGPVWQQLPGLNGAATLLDVFKQQVALGNISCRKIIRNPNGAYRGINYHGCVISDVDESETVQINSMVIPKRITVMYTRRTPI